LSRFRRSLIYKTDSRWNTLPAAHEEIALTTLRDISRLRLRTQLVEGDRAASAPEVVRQLLCVQSQEIGLARWSIGMRMSSGLEADVEAALAAGDILRTHILRPTWHYVLPRDIRWLMRLTAPRVKAMSVGRMRELALDEHQLSTAYDVMRTALAGGNHLNRPELGELLRQVGLAPDGQRLAYIVMNAELDLLVCSGVPGPRKETYALVEERAPADLAEEPADRDQALSWLAQRFFGSHGPATVADLVWWSSLTTADIKRGLAAAAGDLEKVAVDGTDYWWAGGLDAPAPAERVHLLQAFDELVVGYRNPRTEMNVDALLPRGVMYPPPWFNTFLLDGQATGVWRRVAEKSGLVVETRAARPLSRAEAAAVEEGVERYAAFLAEPVEHRVVA
jgi:hypothetical protein